MTQLTDREVAEILEWPKRVGEQLKWRSRRDGRRGARELRATVIPYTVPDYDHDLILIGESFVSRSGTSRWSVGMLHSDLKPPLVRIDTHDKPHDNADGTRVSGCMIHVWSEQYGTRRAEPADRIVDCTTVHAALVGFLRYCNIELLVPYQLGWEEGDYGQL